MPVPVNADVQINALGEVYGQQTVTTFFYQMTAGGPLPEGADPIVLASAWYASFGAVFTNAISQDWHFTGVEVRDPRATPVWASGLEAQAGAGEVAQPACPPSVAAVITRVSGLAGRRNRGRIYMPAVPATYHLDGRLTEDGLAAYDGVADEMSTVIDVPGLGVVVELRPRIWSRVNQASIALTGAIARSILRSQRRREIGVGN